MKNTSIIVSIFFVMLFVLSCNSPKPEPAKADSSSETTTISIDTVDAVNLRISVNGVSFVMKFVEGGSFMMGAQNNNPKEPNYDSEADDDETAYSATVQSYYIGETEVTQALWNAVMNDKRYRTQKGDECGDNYPANYLWWYESQEFIHKLNDLTHMDFRLPSGAEWEFAARGGKYGNGFKYAGSDDIDNVAWADGQVHEVMAKAPNELGLYDMSGNVCELCQDGYFVRGGCIAPLERYCSDNKYKVNHKKTELTPDFPLNRFIGFRLAFSNLDRSNNSDSYGIRSKSQY